MPGVSCAVSVVSCAVPGVSCVVPGVSCAVPGVSWAAPGVSWAVPKVGWAEVRFGEAGAEETTETALPGSTGTGLPGPRRGHIIKHGDTMPGSADRIANFLDGNPHRGLVAFAGVADNDKATSDHPNLSIIDWTTSSLRQKVRQYTPS